VLKAKTLAPKIEQIDEDSEENNEEKSKQNKKLKETKTVPSEELRKQMAKSITKEDIGDIAR